MRRLPDGRAHHGSQGTALRVLAKEDVTALEARALEKIKVVRARIIAKWTDYQGAGV